MGQPTLSQPTLSIDISGTPEENSLQENSLQENSLQASVASVETTITTVRTVTTTVTETAIIQVTAAPKERRKIAVLGGGVGAMSAVFELTSQPDWQESFDITVYQMGWRLGGKGASGRGSQGRIEEHGLHIWLGFYENAFRLIREAYAELDRPAGAPLATWDEAFKPHNYVGVSENINGQWKNWLINFPETPGTPGDGEGDGLFTLWEYIQKTLQRLHDHYVDISRRKAALQDKDCAAPQWLGGLIHRCLADVENWIAVECLNEGEMFLRGARTLADALPIDIEQHMAADHHLLIRFLDEFVAWLKTRVRGLLDDDELRRLWIIADLACAMIRGVLRSGALYHENGLDILDDMDFRDWLKQSGADEISYDSGLVQGLYDLVFAYHNGDVAAPSFAAGAALRSVLRIDFTYKGAIFWKMQASMGDTIFTPLYEVLSRRGVKFEFFHRVKNLGLSADQTQVASIQMGRQVTLINQEGQVKDTTEYDPFILIKDLKCWPSQPNYAQIAQAADLQNGSVNGVKIQDTPFNLESFWTQWPDVEAKTLQVGRDFDLVVLGIPVGAFPFICPELIAANKQWANMVNNVETVRTIAMQLWLKPDLEELGWTLPSPVIDAYVEPQNTWADMTYLIAREDWPAGQEPKNLAYFCGPMVGGIPPIGEVNTPSIANAEAKQINIAWLQQNMAFFWPKSVPPDAFKGFDWNLLADTETQQGVERFDSQFSRVNMDPSERYVLSVAGSTKYRLKADESGFDNLFLTGDWINNEFNIGCVEATVMAGMQCSNAISGYPPLDAIVGQSHP